MSLDDVIRLRDKAQTATLEYHRAIRQAHADGHSLREIARVVGVSHQTIADLIKRSRA